MCRSYNDLNFGVTFLEHSVGPLFRFTVSWKWAVHGQVKQYRTSKHYKSMSWRYSMTYGNLVRHPPTTRSC